MDKKTYNKYISLGFQMIKLGKDKKPLKKRGKNTQGKCSRLSDEYNENSNYACVPSKNIMIIDVDVKKGKKGLESLEKLESDLMQELVPTIQTGSGGLHIYVKIDRPYKIIQKEYPDIDFISYKADDRLCTPYAVAGGQTITNEGKDYVYTVLDDGLYINEVDDLNEVLVVDYKEEKVENDDISVDDLYGKKSVVEVDGMLQWLDASDYHEWMANAAAIKRELGNTEEAFNIFHEWSKTADNYEGREGCIAKWKNVGDYAGTPRTMGTLYKQALDSKIEALVTEMSLCNSEDELKKVISSGKWVHYPKFTTTIVSRRITKLYQSLVKNFGSQITYNDAQKITKALYGKDLDDVSTEVNLNAFKLDDFVRVSSFSRQQYFRLSTGEKLDEITVGQLLSNTLAKASQKLGLKKTLTVQQAFKNGLIQYTSDYEYNPTINERIFENRSGAKMLNMFNLSTVPEATDYTPEGKKLIAKFVQHLKNIMDEDEAEVLLDWMAYAAQNIGKKILWVPMIQSVEGAGKSVIGNLLINHVFGKVNAGVVDPVVLTDSNNSWATNKMLRVLEEIKLSGHNRYEVLNNFKPLITNPFITRKEKFEVSSEVPNHCNFIAFTNYKDALPVDDEDRRWWIVFSSIDNLKDLEKKVGIDKFTYFQPLHDLASSTSAYGSEFKQFLLDRDVSTFSPHFPPNSKHKDELKEIEKGKVIGLDEVQDLINATYKEDRPKVVNAKLIKEASELATDENGLRITPRGMSIKDIRFVLQKLGYRSVTKKQFPNADWNSVSPMFVDNNICSINDAIDIWKKGYDVDFLVKNDFKDLDDEL